MKRRVEMKFVTCPGSRIHTRFESRFDGNQIVLVESGSEDIQARIESFARYTDLHYMLHRLSQGDTSVLSGRQPIYGDFSGLPNNPVEVINLVHNAESRFNSLPLEERSRYNYDYRRWMSELFSSSASAHKDVEKPVEKSVVKDVISDA